MRFSIYTYSLLALLILTGCKNDKKTEPEVKTVETTQQKSVHTSEEISATFKDETSKNVFTEYVAVKTALVNTNAADASKAASDLMTAFANIGVEETTLKSAQNIVESDDIEEQRAAFVIVTEAVEGMLQDAIDSGTVYKQYCPMAFDNSGAYWLSESKEIRNPYFGDKMLKCGRVAQEIQ